MPRTAAVPSPENAQRSCVLLADDDRALRAVLEHQLISFGYEVLTAVDGAQALESIQRENTRLDAIVLDREMPGLTGIEVVREMKKIPGLGAIPVVMQTSAGSPQQIQEGIEAGVFYYLVKPTEKALLHTVISAALRETELKRALSGELVRQRHAFGLMDTALLHFRTLPEAEDLATFLASCYPDPDRVLGGLVELLINAIEHGNLGVGYEAKTALISENRWREELELRGAMPEHADKQAEVTCSNASMTVFMCKLPIRVSASTGRNICACHPPAPAIITVAASRRRTCFPSINWSIARPETR